MRKLFLFAFLFLVISLPVFAVDEPPDFGSFGDEPPAPVNAALSFLLTAGAAYGLKKLHKKK